MQKHLLLLLLAIFPIMGLHTYAQTAAPQKNSTRPDTTFITYPESLKPLVSRKKAYHQTLTMKLFMSQALFDDKWKKKDNGQSVVYLTVEQALDVIRRMDNLTLGIPKIVYLVGWQYNGHDSKYPAWFEGNERLKRPQDTHALESLRWLMNEARKYHTTVSLHINMFDAYEDSPLWDEYVKQGIIARTKDGALLPGEWGYPISYAREWETGYAQKRIDSLCKLLPIAEAGTIHIDAFHTWPPMPMQDSAGRIRISLDKKPTSPHLSYTVRDETAAQENIFRYWASKGVDVTSESVDFLRETSFAGLQPMAWWYGGRDNYLKYPAWFYCGGRDNGEWGKLFGTSMHGEDIVKNDAQALPGFKEAFCRNTLLWYFLNRLGRSYLLTHPEYKAVQYAQNVRTTHAGKSFSVVQDGRTLVEDENVFLPALWIDDHTWIAYSKEGYTHKTWPLPPSLARNREVQVQSVSQEGLIPLRAVTTDGQTLRLSLAKDEMLVLKFRN